MASKTTPLPTEVWPEFPPEGLRDNLTLNEATVPEQLDADWSTLGTQPREEIPRLPPEELKKFVIQYLAGDVFTSAQLPEKDSDLLPMVFLPLALGALDSFSVEACKDIGVCWAYMRETVGTRSINGYPFFGSVRFMHKDDWARASAAILRERSRQDAIEV